MKKYFSVFSIAKAVAAALGLLLFAACLNILEPSSGQGGGPAEGKGLVRVETGAGAARTAIPEAVFDHYEYIFTKAGDAPITPSGAGPVFELDAGNWSVTVKAFAEAGPDTLAAQGSETFAIAGGEETQVTVTLHPAVSEGKGTLNYTLIYPSEAAVKTFTLTLLAGETGTDLAGGAVTEGTDPKTLTGTLEPGSGYYLARARLEKDGIPAEKTEVVHIYQNMATDLVLEFADENFKAFVVLSSADSGPGTLRQALLDAVAGSGGTIVIDLPADSRVITLNTSLPQLTGVLTIEGNGATLVPAPGVNMRFLSVASGNYTTDVFIRRLHFKGGRAAGGGAITNAGKLTLESCIFSDNQATGTSGNGGAIYTGGTGSRLTVLGCTFYGNRAGTTDGQGGAIYGIDLVYLAGNVFWGNTANRFPVVYASSGNLTSGGFNVSDKEGGADGAKSGWAFNTTNPDLWTQSPSVSFVRFRPIGGGAALNVITTKLATYPETDFYGDPVQIPGAAAGAVQTPTAAGYFLDHASVGPGTVDAAGPTPDADGLIISGSKVTLTAIAASNGEFRHWIVDGTKQGLQPTPNVLAVDMDAHKTVRAVFYIKVTDSGNDGTGTLREALASAFDGSGIILPVNETITLSAALPQVSASLVIEGNGATLTRSFTAGSNTQLLRIPSGAEVRISRLHFKEGRAANNGGAIRNEGNLTLESCVFSDNRTNDSNGYGGAVYTSGSLTLLGCTFYGNGARITGGQGGAVYQNGGTLTLTGNVFWGNTAASYPVVYGSGVTSGGFNVSDRGSGTTASDSGWDFNTMKGDKQASSLPVSPVTFKIIEGGAAADAINTRPTDYPATDFYNVPVPETDAAAGAVQAQAGTGYLLDYAPVGPGTVNSSLTLNLNADGLITDSSVTLTAAANGNGEFRYWIVDGAKQGPQLTPAELTVTMDAHKTVRAVFYIKVTDSGSSGTGTLREALTSAVDGSGVVFDSDMTVTLTSTLPQINVNLVIEGNGATLTQGFSTVFTSTQLLSVAGGAEVRISRVHFKGGRATNNGGAINNAGKLTLESCIFSDNRTSGASVYGGGIAANGGAVFTDGDLTVSGCTFYENGAETASGQGGAVYQNNGTLTLTGNVFWGNTAASYPVVYGSGVTSGGFNVSDKEIGTSASDSGWTLGSGDIKAVSLPISPVTFNPIGGGAVLGVITSSPAGAYPAVDFYGDPIQIPGAAGAVQTPAAATGYVLNYASLGPGMVNASGGISSGEIISSSVTLTAAATGNGEFMYWTINGEKQVEQAPPAELTVTMDAHKTVQAVFYIKVTDGGNAGAGTLRQALIDAPTGTGVVFDPGLTVTVTATPTAISISKNLVIEGKGGTLAGSTTYQLLIISAGAEVRISRLHFTRGKAGTGGAINSAGNLTLESCIFSANQAGVNVQAPALGGAVYSTGNLTVSGCTFSGNKAAANNMQGGAIYQSGTSTTLTLTGNVFVGNTPSPMVRIVSGTMISNGFNVSDKGTGTNNSGWDFTNGDINPGDLSVNSDTFKPASASLPGITLPLAGFPALYFDGTPRGSSSAPGAMPAQ
jgi:hypothetical protein